MRNRLVSGLFAAVIVVAAGVAAPTPARASLDPSLVHEVLSAVGRARDLGRGKIQGGTTSAAPLVPETARAVDDLDGDGVSDIAVVLCGCDWAQLSRPMTVELLSGATGAVMWSRDEEASLIFVDPLPVGADGRPALLVQVFLARPTTLGYDIETRVEVVSADGTPAWSRVYLGSFPTVAYVDVAVAQPIDAVAGPTTDILVRRITYTSPGETDVLELLDGRTGARVSQITTISSDTPKLVDSPDVSGDGLRDVLVLTTLRGSRSLSAYAAALGVPVWLHTAPPNDTFDEVAALGDVTGDGRGDAAVWRFSDPPRLSVVDGATGLAVWTDVGAWPVAVGDIDGDGRTDIRTMSYGELDGAVRLLFEAFRGDGRRIYSRAFDRPPGSTASDVGDVDADGIADAAIYRRVNGSRVVEVLSGRTGQTITTGAGGFAVYGSIDGMGDDMIDVSEEFATVGVRAIDGRSLSTLWEASVPRARLECWGWELLRIHRSDRRIDVGVFVRDCVDGAPQTGRITVLEAESGLVRWSR